MTLIEDFLESLFNIRVHLCESVAKKIVKSTNCGYSEDIEKEEQHDIRIRSRTEGVVAVF